MPVKKHRPARNYLSNVVLAVAVIEPLMTVPQIYQIWSSRNAAGVSTVTWLGYATAAAIWLLYGIRIKDRPLIISSALWVITEGMVAILAALY